MDEHIVIGEGSSYPLQGILSPPDHAVPNHRSPAVILIHGSGSTDRDETVYENRPFKDIADYLSEHGVAVIRYDKRSFAFGRKMVEDLEGDLTVEEELIEDALFAADLLRKDPRIDPQRIYLLGHSLGGMMAPRIDAEGGNFAGLIIMAGSPFPLHEIILRQNAEILAQSGFFMRLLMKKQVGKMREVFSHLDTMSEEEARKTKTGMGVYAWYFKDLAHPTVESYLSPLEKPILILQGEKDFQVSSTIDFAEYQRICADKPKVTFKTYPNLNHLFMPSVYGTIKDFKKEYKVPSHVSEEVLADISSWILSDGKTLAP